MLSSKYLQSETVTKWERFINICPFFFYIILQNLFTILNISIKAINMFSLYFLKPVGVWTGPLIWCMKVSLWFYDQQPYTLQGSGPEEATVISYTESPSLTGVRIVTNSLRIYLQNAYPRR